MVMMTIMTMINYSNVITMLINSGHKNNDGTDDDSDNLTMMVVMKMIMSALVIMMAIDGDIVVWVIIMK